MSRFGISQGKGFSMTFENGWTVSVQFGPSNYCEVRDKPHFLEWGKKLDGEYYYPGDRSSATAEIAAYRGNEWYRFELDNVKGWCKTDEVAAFIAEIASKK